MSVRINGPAAQALGRAPRAVSKKAEGGKAEQAESASSTRVSLGDKEAGLAAIANASRGVGEVDEAKVSEIRDAIARGEYQPNIKVVAERMIAEAFVFDR